jgi:hypothetical protein
MPGIHCIHPTFFCGPCGNAVPGFQPKASTSYPTDDGTAVHFLVSGTGTAEKAGNIQQCLAQSIQAVMIAT